MSNPFDPNRNQGWTQQQPQYPNRPFKPRLSDSDARQLAMLAHLLGLLTGFVGPLVLWLVKKDEHPFIDDQGKEALNFQITIMLAMFVSGILTVVCVGFIGIIVFLVLDWIGCIMGAIESNKGVAYRYPMTIRFVT